MSFTLGRRLTQRSFGRSIFISFIDTRQHGAVVYCGRRAIVHVSVQR